MFLRRARVSWTRLSAMVMSGAGEVLSEVAGVIRAVTGIDFATRVEIRSRALPICDDSGRIRAWYGVASSIPETRSTG